MAVRSKTDPGSFPVPKQAGDWDDWVSSHLDALRQPNSEHYSDARAREIRMKAREMYRQLNDARKRVFEELRHIKPHEDLRMATGGTLLLCVSQMLQRNQSLRYQLGDRSIVKELRFGGFGFDRDRVFKADSAPTGMGYPASALTHRLQYRLRSILKNRNQKMAILSEHDFPDLCKMDERAERKGGRSPITGKIVVADSATQRERMREIMARIDRCKLAAKTGPDSIQPRARERHLYQLEAAASSPRASRPSRSQERSASASPSHSRDPARSVAEHQVRDRNLVERTRRHREFPASGSRAKEAETERPYKH